MRHFIQYHNPMKRGPYVYYPGQRFGIDTGKSVDSLRGDRIWLVTCDGSPPRYRLCETFVVDEIDHARTGPRRNRAWGRTGKSLRSKVPIDSATWFPSLK